MYTIKSLKIAYLLHEDDADDEEGSGIRTWGIEIGLVDGQSRRRRIVNDMEWMLW